MSNLEVLEQKRLDIFKKYDKETRTGIILIVFALLFAIAAFLLELELLFYVAGLIGFISIIFFGIAQRHVQTFRNLIKSELILTLLKEQFDRVSYDAKGFIPSSTIVSTGMVKRPDRFYGEDYIRGIYKGVNFQVSDIDLKERVETRDSKGNVHVSYQTYFKGRWYIYQFERRFKDVLKICEGRGYQVNTRGLVKIDTESIEFNKKFSIYASTQEYGFYHITPVMIEKLMELEKLHRGSILYYYAGNELHIGVNDRRDYMELSVKTPINEASLKTFMGDIDLIPAIVNELRLDSSKFKNPL